MIHVMKRSVNWSLWIAILHMQAIKFKSLQSPPKYGGKKWNASLK